MRMPYGCKCWLVLSSLSLLIISRSASAEKWTDSTGKHSVEAEFVSLAPANVTLKKKNGSYVTIPIEKLSTDDQKRANELAGRGGDLTKPDNAASKWTDVTGKYSIEATFVALEPEKVTLKKQDGSTTNVPLGKLNPESQQHAWNSEAYGTSGSRQLEIGTDKIASPIEKLSIEDQVQANRLATQHSYFGSLFTKLGLTKSSSESASRVANADQVVEIKPTGTTDEGEFLIYNYRKMRSEVPATIYDRAHLLQSLIPLRDRANRYHEYVKDRKIDPKVQSLYRDLLSVIDLTSDYVIQLDQIDRGNLVQAQRESAKTGFDAGFAGGSAGVMASQNGSSDADSIGAGIIAAAITYVSESMEKGEDLDESKRQAIESVSEDLKRKLSVVQAHETNTWNDFAEKYHWKKDANGQFVDSLTELENALSKQYIKASTPEEAVNASRAILDAARRIPAGSLYDEHRGSALYWAARAATWAGERELNGKSWGSVPSPSANAAIKLLDEALQYCPEDPDGRMLSQRAWALAIAGRFNEAIDQAKQVFEIRKDDPAFLYNYVALLSCAGKQHDIGISNLQLVLYRGPFASDLDSFQTIDVRRIRTDANLDNLRVAMAEQFNEMVKLKFDWNVKFGWFNDDIILTNRSSFPISNVVLDVKVVQDQTVWTRQLKANSIAPGQEFKWESVLSIPGSRFTSGNANISCDQNK